jgi:hypothetical protein
VARESKGQKVKTFTISVPQPNCELEAQKVQVYFRAGESQFAAILPDHIRDAIGHHPEAPQELLRGEIVSQLADRIQPAFVAACKLYLKIQQNAARKKVIVVNLKANHPRGNRWGAQPTDLPMVFEELSFVSSPALWLTYDVYWQVNDGLYRADFRENRLDHMTYIMAAPTSKNASAGDKRSRFVLDWTEEREAFFKNINDGLVTLIERLGAVLAGDTTRNVDRLIAGGGGLMLPAPEKVE